MSSQDQTVDIDEEDPEVLVVDPEDYQQSKNLEAIFKAKEEVRKIRHDTDRPENQRTQEKRNERLAIAVSYYGSELLPLIDEAIENGAIDRDMLDTPWGDLSQYIVKDGRFEHDYAKTLQSMVVYRQLRRIERELGLGINLEEETQPAQI